jgi:plasmid stability protein
MAAARNITSSLPDDLIRKAKVHAAKCNSTVNALVRKLLEEALSDGRRTRAAAGRLLAIAARGPYFDRDPRSIRRAQIHARR